MSKVIDINSRKSDKTNLKAESKSETPEFDFEQQMKVNKEKQDKQNKERSKGNKSVLKSYRIKSDK